MYDKSGGVTANAFGATSSTFDCRLEFTLPARVEVEGPDFLHLDIARAFKRKFGLFVVNRHGAGIISLYVGVAGRAGGSGGGGCVNTKKIY